jgi:hypothetical protein
LKDRFWPRGAKHNPSLLFPLPVAPSKHRDRVETVDNRRRFSRVWRIKYIVQSWPYAGHFLWLLAACIFYLTIFVLCAIGSWAIVHWYPTAHLRIEQVLIVSLFLAIVVFSRIHKPYRAASNKEALTLRLNAEGFRLDSPASDESFISWSDVQSVTESKCLKTVAIWTVASPAPYLISSSSNTSVSYQSSVDLIRRSVGRRWHSSLF